MNLVFKQSCIPELIFEELGFKTYLDQFKVPLPSLGQRLLKPLDSDQVQAHFKKLRDLQTIQDQGLLNPTELLRLSQALPNLDEEIEALESQTLEVAHLFQLGSFLEAEFSIWEFERGCALDPDSRPMLDRIHKVLTQGMEMGFGNLQLSSSLQARLKHLDKQEAQVQSEIEVYENQIFQETGLRMTYPYPRDLRPDHPELEKIYKSPLLSTSLLDFRVRVEYQPPSSLRLSQVKMEGIKAKIEREFEKKLAQINQRLLPYLESLGPYQKRRSERTYAYVLLAAMSEHGLVLPEFSEEAGIEIKKAVLPVLKAKLGEGYTALDLSLSPVSNVLFGSNMTGKTTVLKTLYFLTTLVHYGLPVPVDQMILRPPTGVFLYLRSSGDLRESLSSLGDELKFWSSEFPDGAYILVDELFQSVEPVSGAALAGLILNHFKGRNCTLLATTHYADILKLEGHRHLRMKPFDSQVALEKMKPNDILGKIPFEVESMGDSAWSFGAVHANEVYSVALSFPLPATLKKEIKSLMTKTGIKR
jgi:DNA mismatch repair ATPase MutS